VRIGVVGLQGDVSEHVEAFETAFRRSGKNGKVILLRSPKDVEEIDAAAIPGGESTTISRLLVKSGLFEPLQRRGLEGMPILGTCAGCILLSKDAGDQGAKSEPKLLGLMDMKVDRNAFGRQRESFEAQLVIEGFSRHFKGVFIRAPAIIKVWGDCRPLSRIGEQIVLARQGSLVGAAFHPELAGDTSLHEWFLNLAQK